MNYIAILRPAYHLAPPAEDQVAFLESCRDYIAEKKRDGKIIDIYWLNVLPFGASEEIKAVAYLDVESHAEAWEILSNYPGYETEGGLEYELWSNVSGEFYSQALASLKAKQEKGIQ
jgi:hypothetical protein